MLAKQDTGVFWEDTEVKTDKIASTIPTHWEEVQLGNSQLFAFENGIWTGKKPPFIDCPIIRNTNFTEYGLLDMANIAIVSIEQRQLETKKLVVGDIIIERSGGGPQQPVGRVAFFNELEGDYCFSNFTTRLRVNDQTKVLPLYLHFYLLNLYFSGHTEKLQNRTTGIRNLAFEEYKKSKIYLPPPLEQQAIAHILQTTQIAIQTRRKELNLERERKAALMQHLFTYGTGNEPTKQSEVGKIPESWKIYRLQEIAEIAYGLTVNEARRKNLQQVPYLAVNNVTRGALRLEEVKQIGMLEGDSKRYRLQKGDVLLVEGNGNPALLGSAAVWNDELPFVLHQNHLLRARPNLNYILPNWLMNYLNSDSGRAQLMGKAKTSSGLRSINSSIISKLAIPVPCLPEQSSITDIISACDSKITALEKEITLHEELFRVLLEELMTGRLSTRALIE